MYITMSLNLSDVEYRMTMVLEKNRLATFKSWHFNNKSKCNAKKLAEAGFYYAGTADEPDGVQCFLCGKALDGWDIDDDPWQEHINHSKACEFAKLATPEKMLTFHQFDQFFRDSIKNHANHYINELKENKKKLCDQQCEIWRKTLNGRKR